jgi:hypothetical protein
LCRHIEKQFDLPAILVDRGNGAGSQLVVVGQEHQDVARILAYRFDSA